MSFRIEYWCSDKWDTNFDHEKLSAQELAAIQPHMKNWTSPWRVLSNDTGNIISKSAYQPHPTVASTGTA